MTRGELTAGDDCDGAGRFLHLFSREGRKAIYALTILLTTFTIYAEPAASTLAANGHFSKDQTKDQTGVAIFLPALFTHTHTHTHTHIHTHTHTYTKH